MENDIAGQTPQSQGEPISDAESKGPPPEVIRRAMNKMADGTPDSFFEITTAMGMGPMAHPLHQKMTGAHVDRILDLAIQHDTNEFNLKSKQQQIDSDRNWREPLIHLVFFGVFVGLIVFICCLFRSQPAVLFPIISGLGGVVTGFLGGLGYAKSTSSDSKRKK